jgi:hypothetical protein
VGQAYQAQPILLSAGAGRSPHPRPLPAVAATGGRWRGRLSGAARAHDIMASAPAGDRAPDASALVSGRDPRP